MPNKGICDQVLDRVFDPEVFGCDAADNGNSLKPKRDNLVNGSPFEQSYRN
jgi:hypothetical protein